VDDHPSSLLRRPTALSRLLRTESQARGENGCQAARAAAASFSVFLLTDLTCASGIYVSSPRYVTNDGEAWLQWVNECIVTGVRPSARGARWLTRCVRTQHLVRGDVLVADNASIHWDEQIQDDLNDLLDTNGVRLMFCGCVVRAKWLFGCKRESMTTILTIARVGGSPLRFFNSCAARIFSVKWF
jgi:hypothetical protein